MRRSAASPASAGRLSSGADIRRRDPGDRPGRDSAFGDECSHGTIIAVASGPVRIGEARVGEPD
ncbi:hypothetical protein [Streptomyces sp. NPDC060366]|uniref:hypothetical protein n=1 Tax=Streptomyces sp. NPDC060366 TaxID=3347105 RepID=UPI00364E8793